MRFQQTGAFEGDKITALVVITRLDNAPRLPRPTARLPPRNCPPAHSGARPGEIAGAHLARLHRDAGRTGRPDRAERGRWLARCRRAQDPACVLELPRAAAG